MSTLSKIVVLSSVVSCALFTVLAWVIVRGVAGQRWGQTYEVYFAPVYSPDGQYVFFVERRISGTAKRISKFSIMMDNPTRYDVSVKKDTFSLKRLNVKSGKVEEVIALSPSPIEGQSYQSVGNRFQYPDAALKFTKEGQLEFNICLNIQQTPTATAKEYSSSGVWTEAQGAKISHLWEESRCRSGYDEWPIFGDWELLEARGEPDYLPVAIVAYNHVTGDVKALVQNKDYNYYYPKGLPPQRIQEQSRRQAIEREQAITRTREELQQKYKAMGMGENETYLRIVKDMQRLGYYPKPTTIVARRLSREEIATIDKEALFSIARDEMESGTFPDIEKAVANPGEEIDHDSYGYPIHRDYTTSARLNTYLKTGGTRFYVRYRGETYELTVKRP